MERVSVIELRDTAERLRPIAKEWVNTASKEFGLTVDLEKHLEDLQRMVDDPDATILLLVVQGCIVGYLGLVTFTSPLSDQRIANEHYWYVLPEARGRSSLKMITAAKAWAKLNGCTHIMFNASRLASDLHDTVCRLYSRLGMKPFETTYISEI